MLESAITPPTQSLEPAETGPKLRVEVNGKSFPANVKETSGRVEEHGNV
jgi:hypothetical protein